MKYPLKQFPVLLLVLFFLLGTLPTTANAQFAGNLEGQLTVTISPRVPSSNTQVTARVENYAIDLQRAPISWKTSNGESLQGVGETYFTYTTPDVGVPQTVTVTVTTPSGQSLTESFTFTPGSVDLLVEADTYTPPFYKGRSLFTHQSIVTVAAIPNLTQGGVNLNPNNLLYTWEKDDQKITGGSGVGKHSMSFLGSIVSKPFFVTVTVESLSSQVIARKRISIEPQSPRVLVYENNPLYGSIFEKAVANRFIFDREEVGLTAIPYFFSVKERGDGNLAYTWAENNKNLESPSLGSDLTFTNKGLEVIGVSDIFVQASHLNNFLQSAKMNFALDIVGNETLETQIQQGNVTVF